ncbi:MAG: sulfatase-like hydrolase/transferase, partial [Verrucomicrobiota bacterium]
MRSPSPNYRVAALVCAFTLTGCGLSASEANPSERPNIIIALADDISAAMLSCYGGESVKTPILDGLAAEGIRFTNCFAPPLCMPARCELLTGLYSHRNFLGRGNVAIGERTIASLLKEVGYTTCQVEKWHLNIRNGAMPPDVGFDEYYHSKLAHNYEDPIFDENGTESSYPGGYGPEVARDHAFDFIERNVDRPFFLYWGMHLPHSPYHDPPGSDQNSRSNYTEKYFAMVEHLDYRIDELIQFLETHSLRRKTILIFLGDNGTPKGFTYQSGGLTLAGGKASLMDSGTLVPMIVNWPGTITGGQVDQAPVDFADFLVTAGHLAGMKPRSITNTDGISLLPRFFETATGPQRSIAFKFGVQNGGKGAGPSGGYWARTSRWKLYEDGRFFDMRTDPLESQSIQPGSAVEDG